MDIWIPGIDDVAHHTKQEYGDATANRKPSGIIFVNGQEVAQTVMCCHCGNHFVYRKGSGTKRGFCLRCMDITCGEPACRECKPYKHLIDSGQL